MSGAKVEFTSHVAEREKEITTTLQQRLTKAALVVEGEAKRKASGRPGPRVQTGRLRASITHQVEKTSAVVGTNVIYAPFLEYGTQKMPAYPFLNPALEDKMAEINKILSGG